MIGTRLSGQRFVPEQSAEMPIGPDRPQALARQYLRTQGLRLDATEPACFYGYYTLHVLRDGAIAGMLSGNGSTGEV